MMMTIKKQRYLWVFLTILFIQGIESYDPDASITGLYTGPYFDPLAKKNLSAHLGEQASLPCTVRQLGDKSVSWVRIRDADILTVDRYTFVGDERFESHYSEPLETWSLIIKYVQERDAGLYECQVSTEPKMSQLFHLRVVSPKVFMTPPGDRYLKAGSHVQIDCQITSVVQPPDYIFWYHGDKRLMENKDPNMLISVKKTGIEALTSTLTILEVPPEANGNYTCMPSNLHSASVNLHVLNEKNPEAMQGERNSASDVKGHHLQLILLMLFLVLLWNSAGDKNNDNLLVIAEEKDKGQITERKSSEPDTQQSLFLLNVYCSPFHITSHSASLVGFLPQSNPSHFNHFSHPPTSKKHLHFLSRYNLSLKPVDFQDQMRMEIFELWRDVAPIKVREDHSSSTSTYNIIQIDELDYWASTSISQGALETTFDTYSDSNNQKATYVTLPEMAHKILETSQHTPASTEVPTKATDASESFQPGKRENPFGKDYLSWRSPRQGDKIGRAAYS